MYATIRDMTHVFAGIKAAKQKVRDFVQSLGFDYADEIYPSSLSTAFARHGIECLDQMVQVSRSF